MPELTIAVIGSRSINDYLIINKTLGKYSITKIISGGAIGVDTLVARYAKAHNISLAEFLPEYEKYGIKAPLVRNRKIVDASDIVIAFWDGISRGTGYTINYAKTKGKPVKVINVNIQ